GWASGGGWRWGVGWAWCRWSRCGGWRAARCAGPLPVAGGSLRSLLRVGCPVCRVTGQPERYWRLGLAGGGLGCLFAPLLISPVDLVLFRGLEFVGLLLVRGGLLAAGVDFLDCHPGRRFLDWLVLQFFSRVGHRE